MGNSRLATVSVPSPNHSGARAYKVTRITPHCMVGQLTAKQCGSLFARSSYQASSNYGIGTDGEIGLYVDEKNQSWCSSSADNDNRAITIECASGTSAPYTMNSRVWASLVALCTDICRRYGKDRLIWFGDKKTALAYQPKDGEMVLTVHRWFANKSCPGDWLYGRMGKLADAVNAELAKSSAGSAEPDGSAAAGSAGEDADRPVEEPNTAAAALIGNEEADREKAIWEFLSAKGMGPYAVAGIMGNLYAESALRPNNLQNVFEKRLGVTDKGYTAAVDNGSYMNFVNDGAGYGLAQWTFHTRKKALLDYAKGGYAGGKAVPIDDMHMQLSFLCLELRGNYSGVLEKLEKATSVREASDAVLTGYEKPANQGKEVKERRAAFGQAYYDRYAHTTPASSAASSASSASGSDSGAAEDGASAAGQTKTVYAVQFGAFAKQKNADKRVEQLRMAGFNASAVKDGGLWKVRLGAFGNAAEAQAEASRARKKKVNAVIVCTEVKA